jgi:hypothetical protein
MLVTSIIFFSPASNYFAASENNDAIDLNYELIRGWDVFFNRTIYGQPLSFGGKPLENYLARLLNIKNTYAWRLLSPGILFVVIYLISFFYSVRILLSKNSIKNYGLSVYLTVLFLAVNIFYVSVVGILAEAGENQRHRFMVEPLTWILFAFFIQNALINRKSKL